MKKISLSTTVEIILIIAGFYSFTGIFSGASRWLPLTVGYYHFVLYSILFITCVITLLGLSLNYKWALIGGFLVFIAFFVLEIHSLLLPMFYNENAKFRVYDYNSVILIPLFLLCAFSFVWVLIKHSYEEFSNTIISKLFKPAGQLIFKTRIGKISILILFVLLSTFLLTMHIYFFEMEYSSKLQQRFVHAHIYSSRHDFYIYISEHPHKRYTRYLISEIKENGEELITEREYCLHAHFKDAIKNVTGKSFGFDYDKWVEWYEKKYNKQFIPFQYYY